MDEQTLRNEMYIEIRSLNKTLTESYLNNLSTQAVINQTHPLYRKAWQERFDNINDT